MFPYIAILIEIIFVYAITKSYKLDNVQKQFAYAFISIQLILFCSLRYGIGIDYSAYKSIYYKTSDILFENVEPGFKLLIDFFHLLNLPFEVFVFCISSTTIYFALKYIFTCSHNIGLSILIFYCFGQYYLLTFNLMRQGIVIYWFLASLILIKKKKFTKYVLGCILMAFFFHSTAIILIPIYFIINKHIPNKIKLAIIILLPFVSKFILLAIEQSSYSIYLQISEFSSSITVFQILMILLSLIVTLFNKKIPLIFSNLNYIFLLLSTLLIVFNNTPLIQLVSRILFYFSGIYIVLIPNLINSIRRKSNKIIAEFSISIIYIVFFIFSTIINSDQNALIPYRTILQ